MPACSLTGAGNALGNTASLAKSIGSWFGDALRSVDWGAVVRWMVDGWAIALATYVLLPALSLIGKLIFGSPQRAGAETISAAKHAGLTDKQAKAYVSSRNKSMLSAHASAHGGLGQIAGAILGGILDGIKRGATGLVNAIIDIVNAAVTKVTFGHGPHIPHLGTGGKGGLSVVNPGFVAQLNAVAGTAGMGPSSAAAVHPHTSHITMHNTFNSHDAHDPVAVGRQVNRALSEFMQGARATRRLHG